MRNARPCGASFAATCVGVKKNTRFDWNAFSTSAAATPSTASPATIQREAAVPRLHRDVSVASARRCGARFAAARAHARAISTTISSAATP